MRTGQRTMVGRVKVYRFRLYDITNDDFKVSARMATRAFIKRIGGELVRSTELEIEETRKRGWNDPIFLSR